VRLNFPFQPVLNHFKKIAINGAQIVEHVDMCQALSHKGFLQTRQVCFQYLILACRAVLYIMPRLPCSCWNLRCIGITSTPIELTINCFSQLICQLIQKVLNLKILVWKSKITARLSISFDLWLVYRSDSCLCICRQ